METRIYFYHVLGVAVYVAFLSPILLSIYLVLRRGRGVRGRWAFLLLGPILAYTVFWFFTVLLAVPVYFVSILLVPAVKEMLGMSPHWVPIAEWFARNWYFVVLVVFTTFVPAITVWVWRRWPAIFAAFVDRPLRSAITEHAA